jgi:phosphohistidine phosphatase
MPGLLRRLVLLRHAKAEPAGGVADELRALAPLGVRQAESVGTALRAAGLVPELALVSSAVRTQETWRHVATTLAAEPEPEVVVSDALYLAHPDEVLELVRRTDARVRTLLVVGHEPAMSSLATVLAGAGEPADVAQVRAGLPTATYAVLDVVGPWADLVRRGAALADVVRPAWRD